MASLKAANAAENDFSVSQAEVSSRQAMLENASDIKVRSEGAPAQPARPGKCQFSHVPDWPWQPREVGHEWLVHWEESLGVFSTP